MNQDQLRFNALLQAIMACKTTEVNSWEMTADERELWDDAVKTCYRIVKMREKHFVKSKT